tara:strand:- start:61 stop:519 length:459 start_codon:yes stop_codon:yes gene_type:complete
MDQIQQTNTGYALLMLLAGMGIPIMAALNAGLGVKLESPALAATILFFVGLIGSVAFLLIFEGIPTEIASHAIPIYFYLSGLFVLFYVLSISWVAPYFGIGNAISFVLLGQLLAMTTIDQFGLMGAEQTSLTWPRILGLVFMSIGVFLVVRK